MRFLTYLIHVFIQDDIMHSGMQYTLMHTNKVNLIRLKGAQYTIEHQCYNVMYIMYTFRTGSTWL